MITELYYNPKTPFLKPMVDIISKEDRIWAIKWTLNEIEKPVRKLRKKYPKYKTPADCLELSHLFLEGKVGKEAVIGAAADIAEEACILGLSDQGYMSFAEAISEGLLVLKTKRHVIYYVCCYLTALRTIGSSEKEIEKEACRMISSYGRKSLTNKS